MSDENPKAATQSTQEKIKEAARRLFLSKGFAATRTRDIAEEAGINLALLNYHFRSKQKLFELVMQEKTQQLVGSLIPIISNGETSLETKIVLIAESYIETLSENPDLPIFVLNELRKQNFEAVANARMGQQMRESAFFAQLQQKRPDTDPIQLLLTLLGMTIFPFISKPMLLHNSLADEEAFLSLMQERKKLIPLWMEAVLNS